MKILVFSTPRSKSTALAHFLARQFQLPMAPIFPIANGGIKNLINSNKIAVGVFKLHSQDLIDYSANKLIDFKTVDLHQYHKIFVINRKNKIDRILSNIGRQILYQTQGREHYTHNDSLPTITVSVSDVLTEFRTEKVFELFYQHILSVHTDVEYFDYENFENQIFEKFNQDVTSMLLPVNRVEIDYSSITKNYDACVKWYNGFKEIFKNITIENINDPTSKFWNNIIF